MLFIGNSATTENAWTPTSDKPIPSRDSVGKDSDVDHRNQTAMMESFNTTTLSEPTKTVEELKQTRKRKMKKVSKNKPPMKDFLKG